MEDSKEFQARMKLIEEDRETAKLRHAYKMEELEFERENSKLMHEQILARGRINRAEEIKMLKFRLGRE